MSESFPDPAEPPRAPEPLEENPGRDATQVPKRDFDRAVAQRIARRADRGVDGMRRPPASDARVAATWPIEAAAAVLRGRWKLSILWCLGAGPRRFNALAAALPGVTPKVLTEQLRELVRDGVVDRHSEPSGPKHVAYELSGSGRDLLPALESLAAWARVWAERPPG